MYLTYYFTGVLVAEDDFRIKKRKSNLAYSLNFNRPLLNLVYLI